MFQVMKQRPYAAAVLVLLLAVLGACQSTLPSRSGDYVLTISTDATEYVAGDPISTYAELAYEGPSDRIEKSSLKPAPIGFGIRQIDGDASAEPSWELQCMQFELIRGQPLRQPFTIGLVADTAASRALLSSMDPSGALRLPAGHWELSAMVDAGPDGANCQGEIQLQATTQIVVK